MMTRLSPIDVRAVETQAEGANVVIEWRESNGPPVESQTRLGFGQNVIKRSLDIRRTAAPSWDYLPEGGRVPHFTARR